MNIRAYNRQAWDKQVEDGNPWTIQVSQEVVAAARLGQWEIYLTPTKPVPKYWFPPLKGCHVLCLASGGGQQGPLLAAAGALVTVYDNSPRQLAQDRLVAERDGLEIQTVEGDMRDLSVFPDAHFDFIVHPVSNCFVPEVKPVWQEAYRVLRSGGALLAGFNHPEVYIFEMNLYEQGILEVKNRLPYSDLDSLTEEQKQACIKDGRPFEFSHTLETLIGGQLAAGFHLIGFYEDDERPDVHDPLNRYMPRYIVTRAIKP